MRATSSLAFLHETTGDLLEFSMGHVELRDTALQTNEDLGEDPHGGHPQTLHAWKVNIDLGWKFASISRVAEWTYGERQFNDHRVANALME